MLIMTNKESRLINAAKRTIRAEATLVIVVLVIVSWSIFGLYKLATGSETIFGFTFAKQAPKQDQVANQSQDLWRGVDLHEEQIKSNEASNNLFPQQQYPQLDAETNYRNRLIQQLLAGQQELNANLGLPAQVDNQRALIYHNHQQAPYSNRLTLSPANRFSSGVDFAPPRLPISSNQMQFTHKLQQPADNMSSNHQHQLNQWTIANQLQNQSGRVSSIRSPLRSAPDSADEPTRDNEVISLSNDREAAESSRNPSESYAETNGDEEAPQTALNNGDEYNHVDSTEPVAQDDVGGAEPESPTAADNGSDSGGGHSDDQDEGQQQQQSSPDQSESGEEPTAAGEETAREESRDIDEEVDRMSQPSSKVTQQQDKPFDYKNTVHFDDTLAPGTASDKISSSNTDKVRVPPGNVIARFAVPVVSQPRNNRTRGQRLAASSRSDQHQPKDLQMDHNSPVSRNELEEKSRMAQQGRQKRSMKQVIRSPYELGAFLDKLNFDPLISESASNYHKVLEFRAPFGTNHSTSLLPGYLTSNDTVLRELLGQKQLFDALKHSQLPAPTTGRSVAATTPPPPLTAAPVNIQSEPKTSGSLNHLNRLLEEAANEENEIKKRKKRKQKAYHESTISKKRKRREQVKAKKKMAIGLERGGHKKKKQNKEEKKFLKEKRFKGAKKGKKVTKGRGGAGGKKGKKLYKDRGYKKKGFKNVAHKEEWGHKKSYFDEFRDKDFKKKWKKYDDKYNYAQMKKFQAKDEKGAKKLKHHDEKFKKFDNGKWKKSYQKHSKEHQESSNKGRGQKKESEGYD